MSDLENNLLQSLCLEILIKNSKSILFVHHYCPPDGLNYLVDNYNTLIHDNINKISNDDKETVISGDFNINCQSSSDNQKEFKEIMLLNGSTQLVKSATRITMTSSLIDFIFVNRPASFPTVCVVATSLSDHELVSCIRKINTEKYPPCIIKCRNYVNYDQTNLINDARVINWEPVYRSTDVNFAVNYLSEKLKHLLLIHMLR